MDSQVNVSCPRTMSARGAAHEEEVSGAKSGRGRLPVERNVDECFHLREFRFRFRRGTGRVDS